MPETRADMAAYIASARVLDDGVGAVLDALAASGRAEQTLVISTTDHGIAFPGMKGGLLDHGIGVSLIMRGPGGFTGGRVVDGMVSQIDLFPTLCELLAIPSPRWLQGASFLPLVRGERADGDEAVYAEVTYHAAYEPQRAVRTKRWKYIRRFGERRGPVLPNVDDSPSKDVWLAHRWCECILAAEQLYDLIFDPNEACNRAADPAYAAVRQEMANRLARWMFDTDDPLLRGPVSAPPGAAINDPNGASPGEPTRPAS
jgi:arylsulfatase A-like enzyme